MCQWQSQGLKNMEEAFWKEGTVKDKAWAGSKDGWLYGILEEWKVTLGSVTPEKKKCQILHNEENFKCVFYYICSTLIFIAVIKYSDK